jgi:hypothetical protein
MGILFISPIPERSQSSSTLSLSDGTTQSSTVLVYKVEFDPTGTNLAAAQPYNVTPGASAPTSSANSATTALPSIGSLLGSTGQVCNKFDVRQQGQLNFFEVQVTFSTPPNPGKTGKWNVKVSIDHVESTENGTRYGDGTIIRNSAGDIYPDGQPKVYMDTQYTISFMSDADVADGLDALVGKVNTDEVSFTINGMSRTFEVNGLLFKGHRCDTTYTDTTNGKFQFSNQIVLLYRDQNIPGTSTFCGWATPLVDKGYRQVSTGSTPPWKLVGGSKTQYADKDGVLITTPIFLNGSGVQLDTSGTSDVTAVFFPSTPKLMQDTAAFSDALSGIDDSGGT